MSAAECLQEMWFELRNGANKTDMAHVLGAIEMGHAVGALSDEQAELWRRRITTCPGHDDEAGRDWCAFCGQLPSPASPSTPTAATGDVKR